MRTLSAKVREDGSERGHRVAQIDRDCFALRMRQAREPSQHIPYAWASERGLDLVGRRFQDDGSSGCPAIQPPQTR